MILEKVQEMPPGIQHVKFLLIKVKSSRKERALKIELVKRWNVGGFR